LIGNWSEKNWPHLDVKRTSYVQQQQKKVIKVPQKYKNKKENKKEMK
jgi:hypothetical protein